MMTKTMAMNGGLNVGTGLVEQTPRRARVARYRRHAAALRSKARCERPHSNVQLVDVAR